MTLLAQRPGASTIGSSGLTVDLAAARQALGTFDDPDVTDAHITNAITAAKGIVEQILGRPVLTANRSVYFPHFAHAMDLLLPVDTTMALDIHRWDEDDALQPFDNAEAGSSLAFSNGLVRLDESFGSATVLTLSKAGREAITSLGLSEYRGNPVRVSYKLKSLAEAGRIAAQTATLQLLIAQFRGADPGEVRITMERAETMLQPWRTAEALL